MSDSLDKIIFVGFKKPDLGSTAGNTALTRLMDITEVSIKNIVFEEKDTDIMSIVKNNFNKDPSSKKTAGYKIGNAVCIGSEKLSLEYQHSLNRLKNLGITMRMGYDDVDITELSEIELNKWFKSGKYIKEINSSDNSNDTEANNVDDILDLLLDEKESTQEVQESVDNSAEQGNINKIEENTVNTPVGVSEEDNYVNTSNNENINIQSEVAPENDRLTSSINYKQENINGNNIEQEDNVLEQINSFEEISNNNEVVNKDDDLDDIISMFNEVEDTQTTNDTLNLDEAQEESQPATRTDISEPIQEVPVVQNVKQEEIPPAVQDDTMGHVKVAEQKDDLSDLGIPKQVNSSATEPSTVSNNVTEEETVDDMLSYLTDDATYTSTSESTSLISTPEQSIDSSVIEDNNEPPTDFVNAQYNERKNEDVAERMRRERDIKRQKEELARAMGREESFGTSLNRENAHDMIDSSSVMHNSVNSAMEDTYNDDGSVKTYKDHLNDKQRVEQEVVESSNKNFGFDLTNAHLSKVSGGRIFLVTAGKGGVGKSLISSGLAAALSLSKAKDLESKTASRASNTWLIEADYTAPQMAVAYKTGDKHIGHLADYLASDRRNDARKDSMIIKQIIEENVYKDDDTGLNVLACPPIVDSSVKLSQIPLAILLAIKYANDKGDDVIIDHGNLTRAEYSDFDKVISTELANYVIIVTSATSYTTAWSVAKMLTTRTQGSTLRILNHNQVSIVLNKVTNEQFEFLEKELAPYDIGMLMPPINALREENARDGDVSLGNMPINVKRAIVNRCGLMLVNKLGYTQYDRYFSVKNKPGSRPTTKRKNVNIFQRIADRFA